MESVERCITAADELREMVEYYLEQPAWSFDVETVGPHRKVPQVAPVAWISFATFGRCDTVPMEFINGELEERRRKPLATGLAKLERGKTYEELKEYDLSKVEYEQTFTDPVPHLKRGEAFAIMEPLFRSDAIKIGHNVKFDVHAVSKYYERPVDGPFFDTLVGTWLMDVSVRGLSLADCVKRELGYVLEKGVGSNVEEHAWSVVAEYSLADAQATWDLYLALSSKYAGECRWASKLLALEMAVMEPVLDMERNGVRIDLDRLSVIDRELRLDIERTETETYRAAGRLFNIRSNQDKQELLYTPKKFGGRGLKPSRRVPSAIDKPVSALTHYDFSVDQKALETFVGDPVVDGILAYSRKMKLHSTYVLSLLGGEQVRSDGKAKVIESVLRQGKVYAQFKQNGAESGRFSSSNPNLQNIPSRSDDGAKLRGVFVSDTGQVLIVADYSQIEPRIIASLSGDETMLETYRDGGDVYLVVGERVGVSRPIGKELVLSIAYGVGPQTISQRTGMEVDDARELMAFFTAKFPAIGRHRAAVVRTARKRGYSQTVLGRRRGLPQLRSTTEMIRSKAERQAYNHLIQGTAADIMKIALVNVHASLPETTNMLMTVHDEIVLQSPLDDAEIVMEIVKQEMESAAPPSITVPLVADVGRGHSWKEAK